MSILNMVLYPDDPLTQKAEPYDVIGPELVALKDDMLETMQAYEGVGLAGPQIGIGKRIFVMQEPDREGLCLINPEILSKDGEQIGEEGCLSIPEIYSDVVRAERLTVRALNEHGQSMTIEAEGYAARIILHEYDHLEGIMFLDRLDILTRQAKLAEWNDVRARVLAEGPAAPRP
jgi:peptide deformylase